MAVPQPRRVLNLVIDTDVGSDDVTAIILCCAAQKKGDANIWGITCGHGNPNVCAKALKTLHTMDRLDIPVYRGAVDSVVGTEERAEYVPGKDGFGNLNHPDCPDVDEIIQKEHAVNYLTRITSENPGAVSLLCLGPLTNIALAIRMDPNFCKNVKEIFIMGGNIQAIGSATAAAEYNFFCDPEAAHIVIHNMKCPITIFPWEGAHIYGRISYEWRKGVLGAVDSPQVRLINQVEGVLLESARYGSWRRSDPLAAAILLEPQVATQLKDVYVTVELHGANTRGAMVVDHLQKLGRQPNVTVVERVNIDLYQKLLLEAFAPDMIGH